MPDVRPHYVPYWEWEDHAAGMYGPPEDLTGEATRARELLANPKRLENAMLAAVDAWPRAALHQLSNTAQNRRSWLGWAACRHAVGATSLATRAAWPQLTDEGRTDANAAADRVIQQWEEDHADAQTLFR